MTSRYNDDDLRFKVIGWQDNTIGFHEFFKVVVTRLQVELHQLVIDFIHVVLNKIEII